jgi:hypothetical protein
MSDTVARCKVYRREKETRTWREVYHRRPSWRGTLGVASVKRDATFPAWPPKLLVQILVQVCLPTRSESILGAKTEQQTVQAN